MFAMKSAFLGFVSFPWVPWGSSDGVGGFGNGDAVDRWAAITNLVWAAAGSNHSWIVLSQAGLGGNAAICIDLSSASGEICTIVLSPAAGFGAANGGADGTATARPTATDELVLLNADRFGSPSSATNSVLYAQQSTDGQCTRLFLLRSGACASLFAFEKARNPIAAWTYPVVGTVTAASGNEVTTWAYLGNASTKTKMWLGSVGSVYFSSWFGATTLVNSLPMDDDSSEWPLMPVGCCITAAPHRGRKGQMFDMWWTASPLGTGNSYPNDETYQFLVLGDLVVPWFGTKAKIA